MEIERILEGYAEKFESELKKFLGKKEPKELYELMQYHVLASGKRVRPFLCTLSCEAVSGSYEKTIPAAIGLELVHSFTLAHDDIMDRDELRRGKPTLWKHYGEPLAINAGDGIFAKAYEALLKLKAEPKTKELVLKIFTDSIIEVCEGQALDVSFENKWDTRIEDYIGMSDKKTASLIGASAKIGAILGKGSKKEIKALFAYGRKLGLAFQIWDDYIDFSSLKTGKTFGLDIKRGKKTSVVCHALKNAQEWQRKKLIEILKDYVVTDAEVPDVVEILESTGSIEYAKNYARNLVESAKKELKVLKNSRAKETLLAFADFVVCREY